MLKRFSLIAILLTLFVLLAACNNDLPTNTAGCKSDPANPDAKVYSSDAGCVQGNVLTAHEGEGEEHTEGETVTEGESAEPTAEAPEAVEEATAEPTAEATEAATAEPSK